MGVFDAVLKARNPVLFDGGLSAELERRGEDLSSELWSAELLLSRPERIEAVSLDFLRAGAQVVCTASYQASRQGYARLGLAPTRADEMLRRSVELARRACQRFRAEGAHGPVLVAASLGPWGACLADGSEYRGDDGKTRRELLDFHRPRVEAVLAEAPDLVLFETIPSLKEVEAIGHLAQSFPQVPFMVSCSAVSSQGIAHGESFGAVVEVLDRVGNVEAIGVNCTAPENVAALLRSVRRPPRALLAVRPNRGETWNAVTRSWEGVEMSFAGEWLAQSLAAGARIVGGCCRVRPQDIGSLRTQLEAPGEKRNPSEPVD